MPNWFRRTPNACERGVTAAVGQLKALASQQAQVRGHRLHFGDPLAQTLGGSVRLGIADRPGHIDFALPAVAVIVAPGMETEPLPIGPLDDRACRAGEYGRPGPGLVSAR
jgi:hypothetical protein